jgi:hypothetical protein
MSDKDQVKLFFLNSVTAMYEKVEKGQENMINYLEWKMEIQNILIELDMTIREIGYLFEKGEDKVKRHRQTYSV